LGDFKIPIGLPVSLKFYWKPKTPPPPTKPLALELGKIDTSKHKLTAWPTSKSAALLSLLKHFESSYTEPRTQWFQRAQRPGLIVFKMSDEKMQKLNAENLFEQNGEVRHLQLFTLNDNHNTMFK